MLMKGARALAAFVAGFALICWLVSSLVPPIHVRQLTDKIDLFRATGGEFDTVFIGSSRTARQVIPREFDQAMAAAGMPTRSFNLGLEGLRPPEDTMVLEYALAGRTTPLKFIIAECNPVQSEFFEDDQWTTRAIWSHDARRLGVYWRHIWAVPLDAEFKLDYYLDGLFRKARGFPDHFVHFAANQCRASEGAARLQGAITGRPRKIKAEAPPADGFYLKGTEWSPLAGKQLDKYLKNLAKHQATPPHLVREDKVSQGELLGKKAMADRLGARLVAVSPPYLRDTALSPDPSDGILFLDYSNPNAWPDFHSPESRRDHSHLNEPTCIRYSRSIAERVAAALSPPP